MFERVLQDYFNKNIVGFDTICNITKNIFQGNRESRDYINHFNIKKVIQIGTKEEISSYKKLDNIDFITLIIDKNDKLIKYFDKVWDFFEYNYKNNILIHCNDGSISLLLVLSYLIAYKFYDYDNALKLIIKKKENQIDFTALNNTYIEEIMELDKNLKNFRSLLTLKISI